MAEDSGENKPAVKTEADQAGAISIKVKDQQGGEVSTEGGKARQGRAGAGRRRVASAPAFKSGTAARSRPTQPRRWCFG